MTDAPKMEGHYWAKWRIANHGTRDAAEVVPSDHWEVVQVFETCIDPDHDDFLMVFVPGVERFQSIENTQTDGARNFPIYATAACRRGCVGAALRRPITRRGHHRTRPRGRRRHDRDQRHEDPAVGIDAPECDQLCRNDDSNLYRCGEKATRPGRIQRPVICTPKDHDQYGRIVAVCKIDNPEPDIAHWLVANGRALDWPKYSGGSYDDAQREVQRAGRGMWAGSFVAPWLYRACIHADKTPSYCSDEAK
ncbi:hypothetical protein ACVI1L_004443 [Bradyrhizobium sp. USDA 4516]